MFAPNNRSAAFVVVTAALTLEVLLPVLPEVISIGVFGSAPEYSSIRISGNAAGPLKVTFTVFEPAVAAGIFFR
jgi:hypothetical protein